MHNMEPCVLVKKNLVDRHFGRHYGKLIKLCVSDAWLASFILFAFDKMSVGQMIFDLKEMYW